MKKIIKTAMTILLALLLASACTLFTSCDKEESTPQVNTSGSLYPNTPTGFKFALNESILNITQSLTPAKEKNSYVPSMTINAQCNGKNELFYFNSSVTFVWTYLYVNDIGETEEGIYTATLELDTEGKGSLEKQIELQGHRSIRSITLDLTFAGYAVKK